LTSIWGLRSTPCLFVLSMTIWYVNSSITWKRSEKCTPQTRNARLAALKTFFYYLGREVPECLDNSRKIASIPQKKVPHKTAEYLDPPELKAIL